MDGDTPMHASSWTPMDTNSPRPAMLYLKAVFLSLTVIISGACGRPEVSDLSQAVDLIAHLPLATIRSEQATLPIASTEGRPYRVSGFSHAQHDRRLPRSKKRNKQEVKKHPPDLFRWSDASESAVRFFLLRPRDLTLILDCRPLVAPGLETQGITVLLGDQVVGQLGLGSDRAEYRVNLPATYLRRGDNLLSFRYAWIHSPSELGVSNDRRRLGVAWYQLRLETDISESRPARVEESDNTLSIPWGNQIDWFADIGTRSQVRIGSIAWEGSGRLKLSVKSDGQDEVYLLDLTQGRGPHAVNAGTEGPTRLRLEAIGDTGNQAEGGVTVSSLSIWSPSQLEAPLVADAYRQQPLPPDSSSGAPSVKARRPNILLYVVDTLRADHLGAYGYSRQTSPVLDEFAQGSTLFEHAVAQSSWTRASMASVFTGQWPYTHGVNLRRDKLSDSVVTLSETLNDAGYTTAAVIGNGNVSTAFGFAQGFEFFKGLGKRPDSNLIHDVVDEWLDERSKTQPFFLWIQTIDPHDPYDPPEEFRHRFAPGVSQEWALDTGRIMGQMRQGVRPVSAATRQNLINLYDAEIAANDQQFGSLLERLEDEGILQDTLVIFTSDHGEEFYEHGGWQHGLNLHSEQLNIPLVIRPPGASQSRRVTTRVQHIDLLPTILEAAGLGIPPGLSGCSLMRVLKGEEYSTTCSNEPLFSWLELDQVRDPKMEPNTRAAIHLGEWKLSQTLEGPEGDRLRLYRGLADPSESRDLASEHPVLAGFLASLIQEKMRREVRSPKAEEAVIGAELTEDLRALGYLE